jgi:predicted glycosyltransferase
MKVQLPWRSRQGAYNAGNIPTYLALREPATPVSSHPDLTTAPVARVSPGHSKTSRLPHERLRIALYSHDAMGLGHMRRNMLIAQTLAGSTLDADVLMIAGAGEATAFGLPEGVDCLTLPALRKDGRGAYHPRNLSLDLKLLLELRSRTICAALESFQPDLFIVDKLARGVLGELDPVLAQLRDTGTTACVLGLRDVLDEPEAVRRDWRKEASEEAIRNYYRAIWVYGDPRVYDTAREYHLPADVARKIHYTGYLDQQQRARNAGNGTDPLAVLGLPSDRLLLCLVGGGQDGARLAEAFSLATLPPDAVGVIVTGPYMPDDVLDRLQRRAAANPRLRVLRFVPEPAILVSRADRVVAMGGYNTTCEILSFRKPALLVPRVKPRLEQWIRASRMADLDLLDVLHPDHLRPEAITCWLQTPKDPPHEIAHRVDLHGLSRLPGMAADLLTSARSSRQIANLAAEAIHVPH